MTRPARVGGGAGHGRGGLGQGRAMGSSTVESEELLEITSYIEEAGVDMFRCGEEERSHVGEDQVGSTGASTTLNSMVRRGDGARRVSVEVW